MHLVFVDDAKQRPTRKGIKGDLIAAGAVAVPADNVRSAERALAGVCEQFGFPAGEEFKWSPDRKNWMYKGLVEQTRADFFRAVIAELADHAAFAVAAIEDTGRRTAVRKDQKHGLDVVELLLERVANRLKELPDSGLLVADRPGGNRAGEDQFITSCLAMIGQGTPFVEHTELALVVTTDSRFVRLLQAADLVTSCIAAYIAGEAIYSPPIAQQLLCLFPTGWGRRGGYSIKLHPDYIFVNLYHWLLGDTDFMRYPIGWALPIPTRPYANNPDVP